MAESQIALGREQKEKLLSRALVVALVGGLTIGYSGAILGQIEALVASLRDKSGLDGVLTALRASKSLERNFLLAPISADLQLDARTALHQETLITRESNRLDGHERAAYSFTFSPDGKFIISTGQDKTVRVWNFSGPLMPPLTKHGNEVLAVAYSSDGNFFVSGDADGVINLWSCKDEVLSRYRAESETSPEDRSTDQDSPCQWIRTLTLPYGPSPKNLSKRIVRLSISPGSQYIAASSFDENVYLWKRSSGPEPFQFMKRLPHNGPVFGLDFSPKDRVLVSGDFSGQVKIWPLEEKLDASTPTPIPNPKKIDDPVYDTRFSFDGKLVAIGGANGRLKVWNRDTDKVVDLPGHREGFVHVLFHPFERRLISADTEGIINLWQPEDLNRALNGSDGAPDEEAPQPIALLGHQGSITRIQFSADGSYFASASNDDTIRLWLTEDGTLLDVLRGHEDEVLNLAFSPERDGQYGRGYLASSSRDGTIRLWQINNDVRPLRHENRLYDVTFHPDGKVLAASGRGRISLWRLQDYELLGKVSVSEQKQVDILSVHYSPKGDLLVAGDAEGNITLWKHPVDQYETLDAQANQKEKELYYKQWKNRDVSATDKTTSSEIAVVRFHPNSQVIAAGSVDGTVRFWDTQDMLLGHQDMELKDYGVTSLDFSRDGKYLVVATSPRLAENALAERHRSESGQLEVYEVSVDEKTLQVSLSRVSTIDASTQGSHIEGILTVVINPANSNEFASGGEDGQIKIWDIEGHLIKTLSSHNGEAKNNNKNRITRVDYSKGGQLLVSSHEDGTIKFWNLSTGRMISSLKRHKRQVAKVVFNSTDSTMLASAGFDAQVLIWTIPKNFQDNSMQKLVAKGCLSADKYLALEEDSDKFWLSRLRGYKTILYSTVDRFQPLIKRHFVSSNTISTIDPGEPESFSNKDEKDIRTYCQDNPAVEESLQNNKKAQPIRDGY